MSSRSLVICDPEEGYATAFASYLMKRRELAFQVRVCNSITQVKDMLKGHMIDILLVDEKYTKEERKEIRAVSTFILAESGKAGAAGDEKVLYKYQSGEALLSQIITYCSEDESADTLFVRNTRTQQIRIIGIFSPIHRCGKTGYALKTGKELAMSGNVLYLGMESYGGIGGYFPGEGQTIVDALYYSRQEGRNLGALLTTMVAHMDRLDYLLPARVSEDVKSVVSEDWLKLIRQILEQSIYDVLILDMDEGICGVYEILRFCTEVHILTIKDTVAEAKMRQFEEELHLLGYDDVRRKLIKKEQML